MKYALIDFNGVAIRALSAVKPSELTEEYGRHLILNSLIFLRKKLKDYKFIIANDSYSWRRDVFPYYKANRREIVSKDPINWKLIHTVIRNVSEELKTLLGWCCISLHGCEADDIIAILCKHLVNDEIVIVSRDKDLYQLTKYKHVRQYNPFDQKFVKMDLPPQSYLNVQIATGDTGDGVPNMLSADDCFVAKKRQKPLRKNKIAHYLEQVGTDEEITKYYRRNQQLIDLDFIPEHLVDNVINLFETYTYPEKTLGVFNYFFRFKLSALMPYAGVLANDTASDDN